MKYILALLLSFFILTTVSAQSKEKFCRAVEQGNFKKIERMFKRQLNKHKNGTQYDNGAGSGVQVTHEYNLDFLVWWFKSFPCVKDAAWDKYQPKIAIYPGGSTIGVIFISKGEIKEYCFSIQEGTTGQVNIFGWRPKLFKAKNILVYKKLSECPGFVVKQHELNMEYLLKGGW